MTAFDTTSGSTFTVTSVTDSTHFTFVPASTPSSNEDDPASTDPDMTLIGEQSVSLSGLSLSGSTVTASMNYQQINLPANTQFSVTISGASPSAYDGTFPATALGNGQFTYQIQGSPGNATGTDIQATFSYSNTLDDAISRLSGMEDQYDGTVLAAYQYLGLSQMVQESRPQPGIDLTYIKQPNDSLAGGTGGDRYTGLDQFGRVDDQNWTRLDDSNPSFPMTAQRIQYGYDQDGNVLYENNIVDPSYSQLFTYDTLNRLTGYQQGQLNGTFTGIVGTPTNSATYTLDAVGNMTTYGSQTRTVNAQNELTSEQFTPVYDSAGELTSGMPANTPTGTANTQLAYDAWGRVVQIRASTNVWETLEYDANDNRDLIYNHITGSITSTSFSPSGQILEDDGPNNSRVTYVWGINYINDLVGEDQSSAPFVGTRLHVYAEQDANFDVISTHDAGGSQRSSLVYDPYGKETILSNGGTSNDYNIAYQGGMYDYLTQTDLFHARILITALGIWNREDPRGYTDTASLFNYEGGNPIDRLDPLGFRWQVIRVGQDRARAISDCPSDTVDALASRTLMDPSGFRSWLKVEDGGAMPASSSAPVGRGVNGTREFSVPNLVVLGIGDVWSGVHMVQRATADDAYDILRHDGFKVDYFDYRYGKWNVFSVTHDYRDLYGLVFFGHGFVSAGAKGNLSINEDDPNGAIIQANFADGKFGLLAIDACDAREGGWQNKASPAARASGSVFVTSGIHFAGWHDTEILSAVGKAR